MKSTIAIALIATLAVAGCNTNTSGVSRNAPEASAEYSEAARSRVSARAMSISALSLASSERQQRGLNGLRGNSSLQRAAQSHADWMARNGQMTHQGAGGSRFSDRVRRAGYKLCYGAENVAYGQRSAEHVMHSWMTSAGHRRNILDPRAADAAIASAVDDQGHVYWTMLLARPC